MDLPIIQFTIGAAHTIVTEPYENVKIKASITIACEEGISEEQFFMLKQRGQAELKALLRETYKSQKPKPKDEKPTVNQTE